MINDILGLSGEEEKPDEKDPFDDILKIFNNDR